jgi:hypothetical protein
MPQSMGRPGATKYTKVPSEKDGVRVMLLGRVEGYALRPMLAGKDKLPKAEPSASQGLVGSQEIRWVLDVLGQGEEFFTQLACGL